MRPAIVLSGQTMALGVVRALGMMGVPVVLVHYDPRDIAQVSKYVVSPIAAPHPEQAEAAFVEAIRGLAPRFGGGVLIPPTDETLVAVSRHKELLAEDFIVACPDWEVVRKFIDKPCTYALAEAHGVPAPKTLVPKSEQEVVAYGSAAAFPCLVKPSQSHLFYAHFKRKMYPVESLEPMLDIYRQAAAAGLEVMLQELIPGDDSHVVNYNAYFWGGQPLVEFTSQHIRNAPPWYGSPRVALSKEIPEIIEPGRKILQALGFYGYACTEFKQDPRDGIYKLMEVNGRHNLSTLLAVECGMNFPWFEYRHLTEGEVPTAADFQKGVYWIDSFRDLAHSAQNLFREGVTPAGYLRPYLNPHIFAIWSRSDPKPYLRRCRYIASELLKSARLLPRRPKASVGSAEGLS